VIDTINRLARRDFPGADVSELLEEPLNICLVDGENGAMFAWRGPGLYEIHLFFAERGRAALNLCRSMLDEMKRCHGAKSFWALIPAESRNVRMFARLMGFVSHGMVETKNGQNELFTGE
jgi:hypothetical protein